MAASEIIPESSPNPLENIDILDQIYPKLDIADLKNFRLVCRQWFEASLKYWRATVPLRIIWFDTENEEETKFRAEAKKNAMDTMAQLASLFGFNFPVNMQFVSTTTGRFDESLGFIFRVMDPNDNLRVSPRGVGIYEFFKLNTCANENEGPFPLLRLQTTPFKRYAMVGWNFFGHEFWNPCSSRLSAEDFNLFDGQFKPNYWFEKSFAPQAVQSLEFRDCNMLMNLQFLPSLYNLDALRTLILRGANFYNHPFATLFQFRNDNKLLKLHTLELNYLDPKFLESNMLPPDMPWSALFNATPNLQKFVMKYKTIHGSIEILEQILKAIRDIRNGNDGSSLNLKVFDIKDAFAKEKETEGPVGLLKDFPTSVVDLLEATKFPLKNLQLDIGCFTDEQGLIPRLIRTFQRTLEVLFVRRCPYPLLFPSTSDVYPFDGDCFMESLKVLQVEGPFSPNFMFLKLLPNLEMFENRIFLPSHVGYFQLDGKVDRRIKNYIQERVKELEKLTGMKYSVNTIENGVTIVKKKCESKQDS